MKQRSKSLWITATQAGELTGLSRKQMATLRKNNKRNDFVRRFDKGHYQYNIEFLKPLIKAS